MRASSPLSIISSSYHIPCRPTVRSPRPATTRRTLGRQCDNHNTSFYKNTECDKNSSRTSAITGGNPSGAAADRSEQSQRSRQSVGKVVAGEFPDSLGGFPDSVSPLDGRSGGCFADANCSLYGSNAALPKVTQMFKVSWHRRNGSRQTGSRTPC
ncbi:unnamed protein product [Phyllotreta striolata]|uniref:Uncharacterized protein n=1 Tax=Phyllotreta striolata TaxID=444603 RepID=A0A9N9THS1_PHYSR|nr:unnamed protein product [Phyllotreta striolata]